MRNEEIKAIKEAAAQNTGKKYLNYLADEIAGNIEYFKSNHVRSLEEVKRRIEDYMINDTDGMDDEPAEEYVRMADPEDIDNAIANIEMNGVEITPAVIELQLRSDLFETAWEMAVKEIEKEDE